jgi:lycopene beta-cyclase
MPINNQYHYIIAGAGLSGLSLALELARRPAFQHKKILLIDKDKKDKNDRTWCFWAKPDEDLPNMTLKTWKYCHFYGENYDKKMDIAPYNYRMIRGLDFYNSTKTELAQHENIAFATENIIKIDTINGIVHTENGAYSADLIFNSAFERENLQTKAGYNFLWQHFKGWMILTKTPTFELDTMTLMDFRVEQCNDTRFVYVLPISETQALVEYTVFSPTLLTHTEYDAALKNYIHNQLKINDYEIIEEPEFNAIPMTDFPFRPIVNGKVINIGTIAGFVKVSTGFTFTRTIRKIKLLADLLEKNVPITDASLLSPWRFRWYDSVLLKIMATKSYPIKKFFTALFKFLPVNLPLQFLDDKTTFFQELRVMLVSPILPFTWAGISQLLKKL